MASQQNPDPSNPPSPGRTEPLRNPAQAESSQSVSADGARDDTGTRLGRGGPLPQLPEEAQTQTPPPPTPPTAGASNFPRELPPPRSDSVYRSNGSRRRQSELDWIIPVEPKREPRPRTVQERLEPTLLMAKAERSKYELKAKMTGYALNIAIGMQVVLGALTTGLSAVTSGRQTSIMTAILGGCSTVVASYLARARGSNEPELSITRVKDLEQYIRECEIFKLDFGHLTGNEHDPELSHLRDRFEELLGNANGERRLASV
ncbi:hypothetical protein C8R47DRAFT_1133895 [Mycena vitilis]|nr:hypothetical protein C8R47DRAFT_1133895 [Mycena vitilis]